METHDTQHDFAKLLSGIYNGELKKPAKMPATATMLGTCAIRNKMEPILSVLSRTIKSTATFAVAGILAGVFAANFANVAFGGVLLRLATVF